MRFEETVERKGATELARRVLSFVKEYEGDDPIALDAYYRVVRYLVINEYEVEDLDQENIYGVTITLYDAFKVDGDEGPVENWR